MLTGKCKEDFESYLLKNVYEAHYKGDDIYNHSKVEYFELFYSLPFSMQYGVYVDWFYSSISYIEFMDIFRDFVTDELRFSTNDLTEARQKAIKKANEIYNQNNK